VRAAEQGKRRRVLRAASGVVALVLLAGLGASLWQTRRALRAEGAANANADQARAERDAKDVALSAERRARQDEAKARQQAFHALRTMTAEVVERKFAQGAVLTEDDRAFLRGVIAQFDAFAAIKEDDPDSRAVRAEGRFRIGTMRQRLGELREAEQDYDQAVGIQKQLAAEFPSRPEFRGDLARSHISRGVLLRTMGRPQAAEQDYDQAVSLLKKLSAEFPSRPEFRQSLATSHNNRGNLLFDSARLQAAERDYDQALSIRRQLAAEFPNQPDRRSDLASTCGNLAVLHRLQGNWATAKRLLLEGRPHHLASLKANPRHPTYRQFYRKHLAMLTAAHAGLLEQDDAVRTAETRRNLGWDAPADAYDAACFLSLCVPIVAKHDKLDATQREETAQFYGDAAMKLLRNAVSKGYKDVAHMKKDTHLDPLRQRNDFQKLVAELEGEGEAGCGRGRPAHSGEGVTDVCTLAERTR
jgi:tetratricopeptide (TPR) repeat protein